MPVNLTKVKIMAGCYLILIPYGLIFGFGTIYPYLYSYVRFGMATSPGRDLDPSWWFPGHATLRGVGILAYNQTRRTLGLRWGFLLSLVFQTLSLFLTYFTFQHSVWATCVTFTFINGFCTGLTFAFGHAILSTNFKETVGKASGVMLSATGVGAIIYDFLVTAYVNPENHATDVETRGLTYFSSRSVVDRAPAGWLIIGTITGSCLVCAYVLVCFASNGTNDSKDNGENSRSKGKTKDGINVNGRNGFKKNLEDIREDDRIYKQKHRPASYSTWSRNDNDLSVSLHGKEDDDKNRGYQCNTVDSARIETCLNTLDIKISEDLQKQNGSLRTSCDSHIMMKMDNSPTYQNNDSIEKKKSEICKHSSIRNETSKDKGGTSERCWNIDTSHHLVNPVEDECETLMASKDHSVLDAFKSISFYSLCVFTMATNFGQLMVVNYYKMLGQLWIADDFFLTMTGNLAAIGLILYRIFLGWMVDVQGLKNTLVFLTSSMCVLMACWYFTAMASPWLFLLWTDLLMVSVPNFGLLMPIATLKLFGPSNYMSIYGWLQMTFVLCCLTFAPLFSPLIATVGWFWVLALLTSLSIVSLLMTVVFLKNDKTKVKQ